MMQMPLFVPPTWSVSQLNRYIHDLLENDLTLQELWVQGEVSNLTRATSGHLYFTLKDQSSAIKCIMWRNSVNRLPHLPRDGDAIEVHGSVAVYETSGVYQLYADALRPVGVGDLFQEFIRLKNRLEAEGLFEETRKRSIPAWPQKIGIVTSPTGAAIRDILKTIQRRYPAVKVIIAPTQVQGEEAPGGIIRAMEILNQEIRPDVIIIARGGGSIEDLWAFNDELVARAIYNSNAPVICGVGHETDFTIADFVSDLRAPTPTAAAELATPNRLDLHADLVEHQNRLVRAVSSRIDQQRWRLDHVENRLASRSPTNRIRSDRQRLDEWSHRANQAIFHQIRVQRARLEGLGQYLVSLNPTSIFERGYAMISRLDGKIVRSVNQANPGDPLIVQVSDGKFQVEVKE
jgi:exodeoxyribonuclease VII large subunit